MHIIFTIRLRPKHLKGAIKNIFCHYSLIDKIFYRYDQNTSRGPSRTFSVIILLLIRFLPVRPKHLKGTIKNIFCHYSLIDKIFTGAIKTPQGGPSRTFSVIILLLIRFFTGAKSYREQQQWFVCRSFTFICGFLG